MTRPAETLARIEATGVVAVVRLATPVPAFVAAALGAGGIAAVEITLTTPGAMDTIGAMAAERDSQVIIGAGTVLAAADALTAIRVGAAFIVSPVFDPDIIRICREHDTLVMPGAFTPSEIHRAWRDGAHLVKVFPSSAAGPAYFRELLAPMPFLKLVPSGGVTLANAAEWIGAGAAAISVGGALVDAVAVRDASGGVLTDRARTFVEAVMSARAVAPARHA